MTRIKNIVSLLIAILVAVIAGNLALAWTNPTQSPPNGNLSLPSAQWTASGTAIYNSNSGNVGIGITNPGQKFSVAGTIESTSGGFKFPDGTTQATALTGGYFVKGVVGARASVTTYTLSSADMIGFYNPTTKVTEKIVTAQGSLTADAGVQGRNGRDQAGAFTAGSWVYLYYTWDGSTVATRLSASAPPTGPTLANGETSLAFVAALRWNGSSNFIDSYIRGSTVHYKAEQSVLSSSAIVSSYTGVDLSGFVPPQSTSPEAILRYRLTNNSNAGDWAEVLTLSLDGSVLWAEFEIGGSFDTNNRNGRSTVPGVVMPNISQTFYYQHARIGVSGNASVAVIGYRVANGNN